MVVRRWIPSNTASEGEKGQQIVGLAESERDTFDELGLDLKAKEVDVGLRVKL